MKVGAVCLLTALTVSCGSTKKTTVSPAVNSTITTVTSLEGQTVNQQDMEMSGIDYGKSLSEDGTQIIQVPYKWFAGIGSSSDKQIAIELAQREAYANITRVINNAVRDEAQKGALANNDQVQRALTSHWTQFSQAVLTACEPFGSVTVEYDPSKRVYKAIAKIGVAGTHYNKLLETAGNFTPADLDETQMKKFIDINRSIIEASKVK